MQVIFFIFSPLTPRLAYEFWGPCGILETCGVLHVNYVHKKIHRTSVTTTRHDRNKKFLRKSYFVGGARLAHCKKNTEIVFMI